MKLLYAYLLIINLMALLVFFIDKKKAIKHKYRIKEKALLSIAALGGSVGSLIAINCFKHKNRKIKFKLIYLFLIVHLFILYTLLK